MLKFYELWNPSEISSGTTAGEALQAAQAHVRSFERWKHARYWASWFLWGPS